MKKIIFILSAITCVYTMSCQNNPKSPAEFLEAAAKKPNLNVSHKEYVVNVPAGWRRFDTSMQGLIVQIIDAPKDGNNIQSDMVIINEDMRDYSFENFVKNSLNSLSSLPSFKELEQGYFETDAHVKGKWLHYSYTMNGYDLEGVVYIISIDGIAYEITGTSPSGSLDKYKNDFDAMAKSFHLK